MGTLRKFSRANSLHLSLCILSADFLYTLLFVSAHTTIRFAIRVKHCFSDALERRAVQTLRYMPTFVMFVRLSICHMLVKCVTTTHKIISWLFPGLSVSLSLSLSLSSGPSSSLHYLGHFKNSRLIDWSLNNNSFIDRQLHHKFRAEICPSEDVK